MAVRSAEIGHANGLTGAGVSMHTVAAGTTLIVKNWSVKNRDGSTRSALLFIIRSGVEYDLWRADVAAGAIADEGHERFIVLEPGDELLMAGHANSDCWVSGTILQGVA